jgi:chromosome segregation ATPase
MPIFSKSPAKALADATAARDKLAERLRDAEIAVTDLRKESERLAILGAADDQLDTAEARTRAMVDRVTTLSSALAQSKATVADLERERDEAADKKQREATSAEVEQLARAITSDCARMVAVAASLAERTAQAAPAVPESGGSRFWIRIRRRRSRTRSAASTRHGSIVAR